MAGFNDPAARPALAAAITQGLDQHHPADPKATPEKNLGITIPPGAWQMLENVLGTVLTQIVQQVFKRFPPPTEPVTGGGPQQQAKASDPNRVLP